MLKMITSEVPAGLETYYTATESGQFRLNVEDAVPTADVETLKQKNKEFRDNNVSLLKENEKFKSFSQVFGSENVSAEKLQEKIDALASSRVASLTEQMKTSYETKVNELNDKLAKSGSRLSDLTLGSEIIKAASDHGVISSALEDVQFRARNVFNVNEEGTIKFKEEKLDASGKAYTVTSWMQEMKTKAPHLFAPSQGTGAKPIVKGSGNRAGLDNRSAHDRLSAGLSQISAVSIKKLT
jgi:hypothetical protein